jgi:DNA-binding transcriptional ArsR family regulator
MSLDRIMREEARLILLKALAAQIDERLNSELLRYELESFGISKTRAWVHDELSYLTEMGAVTVVDAGSVRVATLTEKGAQHLKRQIVIEGVRRPSRPGD